MVFQSPVQRVCSCKAGCQSGECSTITLSSFNPLFKGSTTSRPRKNNPGGQHQRSFNPLFKGSAPAIPMRVEPSTGIAFGFNPLFKGSAPAILARLVGIHTRNQRSFNPLFKGSRITRSGWKMIRFTTSGCFNPLFKGSTTSSCEEIQSFTSRTSWCFNPLFKGSTTSNH